jgi:hypothetical protein
MPWKALSTSTLAPAGSDETWTAPDPPGLETGIRVAFTGDISPALTSTANVASL